MKSLSKSAPGLRLRRAQENDCRRLWEWANDPEVRSVSFTKDPIPWEAHVAWFAAKLMDSNCVLYIAETETGDAIGQIRFDRNGPEATVSISLDKNFRGRGFGMRVLTEACVKARRESGLHKLHAYIKPGNEASVRAFEAAGFAEAGEAVVGGAKALHFTSLPATAGQLTIGDRQIGPGQPVFVIAELSANHQGSEGTALALVRAAKEAGADAVKLQTYTADTLTFRSDRECFRIGGGTLWDGRTLHDLYTEAYMPWEWQPRLKAEADKLGLLLFSSPFDPTAVDFLEEMGVPVYKVASPEIVDIPLIQKIASAGKPMILSTGMASAEEIEEALAAARGSGCQELALLKCTSAYPAPPEAMNLRTIPAMAKRFGVPVGLSDHTMGIAAPVAAVALGACIVEKHFTLSRAVPGPDSAFSLEPEEFRAMVQAIRTVEKAVGTVHFGVSAAEAKARVFRRSLFVVAGVKRGERFTAENVRSIRPGHGLHPRHLPEVLGSCAARDIEPGTPLSWELVAEGRVTRASGQKGAR